MLVPDATVSVIKPSIALQSPYMQIRVSFLSSMKTPQNIYFYIWIPASKPSRHMGSAPRKIYSVKINDPNKRDLYTCGVSVESVSPVADLCPANQLVYQTVQSGTAE